MRICKSLDDLKALRRDLSVTGQTLGFVPTMGALHAGHLSLCQAALDAGHAAMASIFVNPTQFAVHEDLDTYPETFDADIAALAELGVTAVFAPSTDLMYPAGEQSRVRVDGITSRWEGEDRPHFFEGVATVVTKLLSAAQADAAYFGEKDYQQLQMIRRMSRDLLIDTHIVGCPTVREDSGLALSSRNGYLNALQKTKAASIFETLSLAAAQILDGAAIDHACTQGEAALRAVGFESVSYFAYVCAETLEPAQTALPAGTGRLLFAGTLGTTRLIDNIAV